MEIQIISTIPPLNYLSSPLSYLTDSGQFRYDLKEAEEDGEGGGREGDAGPSPPLDSYTEGSQGTAR